jgi:hypothetical protein
MDCTASCIAPFTIVLKPSCCFPVSTLRGHEVTMAYSRGTDLTTLLPGSSTGVSSAFIYPTLADRSWRCRRCRPG